MASEAPLVRMFCIISQLTVWLYFVFMAHLMTNSTGWFQASLLDPWFGSSVALASNLCCGAVFSSEKPSMQLESTVLHQSIQIHLFYISNSVVLRKVWPQHQITIVEFAVRAYWVAGVLTRNRPFLKAAFETCLPSSIMKPHNLNVKPYICCVTRIKQKWQK